MNITNPLPNVAQGNRKTASDWNTIWRVGFRAGREKAELEHADEIIESQDCRTWLMLSGVCLVIAVLVAWSLIANGNLIIIWRGATQ